MRRWRATVLGALAVASCLVPNFELVDSFDDEAGGGTAGTSTGGSTMGGEGGDDTGGSSGKGGSAGSSSGAGGTSGSSGKGGMSGTSGAAGAGGGCDTGLTECEGECVNLETDGSHCGNCETACGGTLACLDGVCEADCGTRLRCGNSCCADPPANSTATCVSNTCGIDCAENYHGCGAMPDACYPDMDATHCGLTCINCTQPNATAACVDTDAVLPPDACGNTCNGLTFECPGVGGKPACGSWDFESATPEGWFVSNDASPDPMAAPSAWDGTFLTRTSFRSTGQRALAIGVNSDGVNHLGIQLRIRLCPSGQALNLVGRRLRIDTYAETAMGTPGFIPQQGYHYFIAYNGNDPIVGCCDFPSASDEWVTGTWDFPVSPDVFTPTDLVFFFRVLNTNWRGTLYVDNIRIE